MQKQDKIFIAGGTGMVGSAIIRALKHKGYTNLIATYNSRQPNDDSLQWVQLDLTDQSAVQSLFTHHQPDYVFLAAAKVGGIQANNTYPADKQSRCCGNDSQVSSGQMPGTRKLAGHTQRSACQTCT